MRGGVNARTACGLNARGSFLRGIMRGGVNARTAFGLNGAA